MVMCSLRSKVWNSGNSFGKLHLLKRIDLNICMPVRVCIGMVVNKDRMINILDCIKKVINVIFDENFHPI